jgi:hypothetical protein
MNKQDLTVQKEGKSLIPSTWPANGIIRVKHLSGSTECLAKSIQSTATGVVSVHLQNDYNSDGSKAYTLVSLTAEALVGSALVLNSANEVPCVFDEILQTGTDIALSALTIWI